VGAPNLPAALFVSPDLTERTITLGDGSSHKLKFREASAKTWRRYYIAAARVSEAGEENDEFERATADLIAASLCNDDGTPALTRELAQTLKFEVQTSIVKALRDGLPAGPGKV
jgi:hypothetical protein